MARVESTTGWVNCVLGACLALATLASPGALALAEAPAATRAGRPRGVPAVYTNTRAGYSRQCPNRGGPAYA